MSAYTTGLVVSFAMGGSGLSFLHESQLSKPAWPDRETRKVWCNVTCYSYLRDSTPRVIRWTHLIEHSSVSTAISWLTQTSAALLIPHAAYEEALHPPLLQTALPIMTSSAFVSTQEAWGRGHGYIFSISLQCWVWCYQYADVPKWLSDRLVWRSLKYNEPVVNHVQMNQSKHFTACCV